MLFNTRGAASIVFLVPLSHNGQRRMSMNGLLNVVSKKKRNFWKVCSVFRFQVFAYGRFLCVVYAEICVKARPQVEVLYTYVGVCDCVVHVYTAVAYACSCSISKCLWHSCIFSFIRIKINHEAVMYLYLLYMWVTMLLENTSSATA